MNIKDYKSKATVNTFKEFVQSLLDGNLLYNYHCGEFVKLDGSEFKKFDNFDDAAGWNPVDLNDYSGFDWHILEEVKWFDNIPSHGILCWVSDSDESDHSRLEIVAGVDFDGDFLTEASYFKFATPAKLNELKPYTIG